MSEQLDLIEILLVEDNPGDVRLTQEAFKDGMIRNRLWVANDGQTALQMLRREGQHGRVPPIDLVVLDLNLPGMGGHDVLRELKGDTELRTIPVVILSSSAAERDILRSYDLHANCYVTKPLDLEQFIGVVQQIQHFWVAVVKPPRR